MRVLILDEAQHLVIPEKRQLNFEAADWVKGLANKGVCAVMLAGVPDAWEAYMYNGQLRRRSFGNRRLTPFAVSDQVGWRTFRGLVRAFARLLPFADVTCLADQVTALQLHRQCGGFGRTSRRLPGARHHQRPGDREERHRQRPSGGGGRTGRRPRRRGVVQPV